MKIKAGTHLIEVTNEDKLLVPPDITKKELMLYYEKVGARMLPYLKNRPIMMQRFPDGLSGESFYQKSAGKYFPAWIKTKEVAKEDGQTNYVICQNRATLLYVISQATITLHGWTSKLPSLNKPDRIVFDLDPSGHDFSLVIKVAYAIKELLDALKLHSFVMTTGSKGVHIHVPLKQLLPFEKVKYFSRECAALIVKNFPESATLELRKDKRAGKVFIDYLRNEYGATSVVPYSIRAHPGGPIAAPIDWNQVTNKLDPQEYKLHKVEAYLTQADPWHDYFQKRQSLTWALKELKKL